MNRDRSMRLAVPRVKRVSGNTRLLTPGGEEVTGVTSVKVEYLPDGAPKVTVELIGVVIEQGAD